MGHYDDLYDNCWCSCGSYLIRGICEPCYDKRRLERKVLWDKADGILKNHGIKLSDFAYLI